MDETKPTDLLFKCHLRFTTLYFESFSGCDYHLVSIINFLSFTVDVVIKAKEVGSIFMYLLCCLVQLLICA